MLATRRCADGKTAAMLPVGRCVIDTAHVPGLSAPIERQYPPTNSDELSSCTSGIFWKCQTGTVVSGLRITFPVPATAPMTHAAAPSRSAACCATLLICVSERCRKVASAQSLARRRTAQTRAGRWQAVAWRVPGRVTAAPLPPASKWITTEFAVNEPPVMEAR